MNDWRDLVIEALAHSEAILVDRVADLTSERNGYRVLAHEALHAVRKLTLERARLQGRLYVLLDELRVLREQQRSAA